MVSAPAIIIISILVFIILLILFFAFTGHIHTNPHLILIIILIGILLFTGYLIAAYYKKWWPYRNPAITTSDQNFNNVILYITLAVIILVSLILGWVIYLAIKHHRNNQITYTYDIPEKVPLKDVTEKSPDIQPTPNIQEKLLKQEELGQGNKGLERAEIERLALENQLQEEGSNLEEESKLEIIRRNQILMKELEGKNISKDVVEQAEEFAALKEIEADKALRSPLPSVEMFGPSGSEDVINRMQTVPKELETKIQEEIKREKSRPSERSEVEKEESIELEKKGKRNINKQERKEIETRESPIREQKRKKEESLKSKQEEEAAEEEEVGEAENIKGFESETGEEGEGLFSRIETEGAEAAEEVFSEGESVAPELEEGAEIVE